MTKLWTWSWIGVGVIWLALVASSYCNADQEVDEIAAHRAELDAQLTQSKAYRESLVKALEKWPASTEKTALEDATQLKAILDIILAPCSTCPKPAIGKKGHIEAALTKARVEEERLLAEDLDLLKIERSHVHSIILDLQSKLAAEKGDDGKKKIADQIKKEESSLQAIKAKLNTTRYVSLEAKRILTFFAANPKNLPRELFPILDSVSHKISDLGDRLQAQRLKLQSTTDPAQKSALQIEIRNLREDLLARMHFVTTLPDQIRQIKIQTDSERAKSRVRPNFSGGLLGSHTAVPMGTGRNRPDEAVPMSASTSANWEKAKKVMSGEVWSSCEDSSC